MVNVNKLKGRMVELSITQEELASLIGISCSPMNIKINGVSGNHLTLREVGIIIERLSISDPRE